MTAGHYEGPDPESKLRTPAKRS